MGQGVLQLARQEGPNLVAGKQCQAGGAKGQAGLRVRAGALGVDAVVDLADALARPGRMWRSRWQTVGLTAASTFFARGRSLGLLIAAVLLALLAVSRTC